MDDPESFAWRKLGGKSCPTGLLQLARTLEQEHSEHEPEPTAEQVREAAYAEGFEQGLKKGLQQAEAQAELAKKEAQAKLDQSLTELGRVHKAAVAELKQHSAGFLSHLFEVLFRHELSMSDNLLQSMVNHVLMEPTNGDTQWTTLKVSQQLFDSFSNLPQLEIDVVAEPLLQGMRMEIHGLDQVVSFDPQDNLHTWLLGLSETSNMSPVTSHQTAVPDVGQQRAEHPDEHPDEQEDANHAG